jgi:hypothetical protein
MTEKNNNHVNAIDTSPDDGKPQAPLTPRAIGRAVITGEAQFLHDTFNGKSIGGDALDAARRLLDGNVDAKSDKSDRHDIQGYLEHLDRLQAVITKSQKQGKSARADRLIQSFVDSVCSHDAGFITTELSERAKELELNRLNDYEKTDAKKQGREARSYSMDDVSDEKWQEFLNITQSNQRARISSWVRYLAEPESVYPTAFKFYAVRSLLTLKNRIGFDQPEGPANEEGDLLPATGHHYKKRDAYTLDAFPELNREALAKTFADFSEAITRHKKYSTLTSHADKSKKLSEPPLGERIEPDERQRIPTEDEATSELKKTELNFAKLYAHNMDTIGGILDEERANMTGRWVTYTAGEERLLSDSLEGFNTGWCIADSGTSEAYLEDGTIDIFYSKITGAEDAREVPRLCIRRRGNSIAEVRGIDSAQAVEPIALDTLKTQLSQDPEGSKYLKKAEFQELAQSIIEKSKTGEVLTTEELKALWGIGYTEDQQIGFGYGNERADVAGENAVATNLSEVRVSRVRHDDLMSIFADKGELAGDYALMEEQLLDQQFDVVAMLATRIPHKDIATRLFDAGRGSYVANNLDKFTGLDHQDIATRLIEAGQIGSIAYNLDKFNGLDHQDIATRLIEAGQIGSVANNLDKFTGLDHQDIINRLLYARQPYLAMNNLDKFTGLDHQDIINRFIDAGQGKDIVLCLNRHNYRDHRAIANRLIEAGEGSTVAKYIDKFFDRDHRAIANRLIEAGEGSTVAENLDKFTGLDFSTIDRIRAEYLNNLPVQQLNNQSSLTYSKDADPELEALLDEEERIARETHGAVE